MQKKYLFLLSLLLVGFISKAQVKEGERGMSQGVHNSLSIELPNTTEKFALKVWKDYIEEYKGDQKRLKNKGYEENFTDNAEIPAIGGDNTVDLYFATAEAANDVIATIWVDLGGAWLNSAEFADKYKEAEKILLRYGIEVARQQTLITLEEEQKKLKKAEGELKDLTRENEGYHKDIDNAREKIKKAEANIEKNLKDQEASKQKIEAQRKAVEAVQKKLDDL